MCCFKIGHWDTEIKPYRENEKQRRNAVKKKVELSHGFSTNTELNVQKCVKFPYDSNVVKSVGKKSIKNN